MWKTKKHNFAEAREEQDAAAVMSILAIGG
jgi:hypothetical protein